MNFLPLKRGRGHFYEKYSFSPVKNVKKCRGRDLTSLKDFNIKFHNGGLLNGNKNFALILIIRIKLNIIAFNTC